MSILKPLIGITLVNLIAGSAFATTFELGAGSRTNLGLTVFNANFAVVRDTREVVLPVGDIELEFTDVARTIFPPTVSISADKSSGLRTYQQNYRFDLLNPNSLLERFVGRKVKYSRFLLQDQGYEKVLREGILLSIDPAIVKFGDVIEVAPEGTISLPYIPDDLKTTPTLVFRGTNDRSGAQEIRVRYHAGGINWEADYALTIDKRASLSGWVTIRNQSSSDFHVDDLTMVAGELNVNEPLIVVSDNRFMSKAMMESAPVMETSTPGEYHAYRYPKAVSLLKNDMTQLELISAAEIRYEKSYRLVSAAQQYGRQEATDSSPEVWISIDNTPGDGLNEALPAGNMRVYEKDGKRETFIGESRIPHVPAGRDVEFKVGRAFDFSARRIQTTYRRLGERAAEVGYRIELTSAKSTAETVQVLEQLSGDWAIVSESLTGKKLDAMSYAFNLKVPAKGTAAVEYLVSFSW